MAVAVHPAIISVVERFVVQRVALRRHELAPLCAPFLRPMAASAMRTVRVYPVPRSAALRKRAGGKAELVRHCSAESASAREA